VDDVIALDAAALLFEQRREQLQQAGCEVPPITWRDQGVGWPPPLRIDRAQVVDPDSIGITVRYRAREGEFVLFKGGWADLEFWSGQAGDAPIIEAPGADDPLTLAAVTDELDRFVGLFLRD